LPEIGGGVEAVEEFLWAQKAQGHHKGLVPVVSTPEIPVLESPGHSQLGELLPIPENTEFRFPRQNFPSSQDTAFPTDDGNFIILEDLRSEIFEGNVVACTGVGSHLQIGLFAKVLKSLQLSNRKAKERTVDLIKKWLFYNNMSNKIKIYGTCIGNPLKL